MNDGRATPLPRWRFCYECPVTHGTVPAPTSSGCATVATICFAIVAAVALVFCSLAPAWATYVPESAPPIEFDAKTRARLSVLAGVISSDEAFELWNDCQPIAFSVHLQGKTEASKIGLTRESIETAVRSRLRGARIFRNNPDLRSQPLTLERNGFLQVSVALTTASLGMSMRFEKVMTDEASGHDGWTPTGWRRGLIGGHADDGYCVLSGIASATDEFIDDYLRVNESACSR